MKRSKIFSSQDGVVQIFTEKPFDARIKDLSELCAELGLSKIVAPVQTHSANVAVVKANNLERDFFEIDGLITNLAGVGIATVMADCQSVVIYDPVKQVVANLHSGWKGTLNGIVKVGVDKMVAEFGCSPRDFLVYISPCIHKECFEVQEDVKKMFSQKYGNEYITDRGDGRFLVDTVKINVDVLMQNGVLAENIETDEDCTKCLKEKYHSYRGDGESAGRNASVIGILNTVV